MRLRHQPPQPMRAREARNATGAMRGRWGSPGGQPPTVHRSQRLPAPVEEIVPSKEPMVVPVNVSYQRSQTKLPDAPANRPVPSLMTAVSTMYRTPGSAVGVACLAKAADSV